MTKEELALGTDPFNPDTNGDGISDFTAVRSGLNATTLDMDGDGVPNAVERAKGTDPLRTDTDGDGVSDGAIFPARSGRAACPARSRGRDPARNHLDRAHERRARELGAVDSRRKE